MSPVEHIGPGPAYDLPGLTGQGRHDPRSTHPIGPAWSIGSRRSTTTAENTGQPADASPGPKYYPDLKILQSGKTVTIKSRPRDLRNLRDDLPGPGSYSPPEGLGPASINQAPAYSFGMRLKEKRPSDTSSPGPGTYSLKSSISSKGTSSVSMGGRKNSQKSDESPGPADYTPRSGVNRFGKSHAPTHVIVGRRRPPEGEGSLGPGPGAYLAGVGIKPGNNAGATIAGRHPDKKEAIGPGPGAYVPKIYQASPAYSMQPRRSQEKIDKRPGPLDYSPRDNVFYDGKREGPKVSMKGRSIKVLLVKDDAPGPGSYSSNFVRNRAPSWVFGAKAKEETPDPVPGPGEYVPEASQSRSGPAYTIGGRRDEINSNQFPGPLDYRPPSDISYKGRYSVQKCTITPRRVTSSTDDSPGPGPGAYQTDPAYKAAKLKREPAYTLVGRRSSSQEDISPGPAYLPNLKTMKGAPAFTFAHKGRDPTPADTPGPNAYFVDVSSVKAKGPKYSMIGRGFEATPSNETPGPGQYDTGRLTDSVLQKAPAYTMAGRNSQISDHGVSGPGPGTYLPDITNKAGGQSFGVKYPEKVFTWDTPRG